MKKIKRIKRNNIFIILLLFISVSLKSMTFVYNLYVYYPINTSIQDKILILNRIYDTNIYFKKAHIQFRIMDFRIKNLPDIASLMENDFYSYNSLISKEENKNLTIWIVNDEKEPCEINENYISCSFKGGFSYINPYGINNVVVSKSSLNRKPVFAHELGHLFGLEHTFKQGGDNISDTPYDPGMMYNIFVSYEECEMFYKNYKPMINNIMAYYSPCVYKDYTFTKEQCKKLYETAYSRKNYNSILSN